MSELEYYPLQWKDPEARRIAIRQYLDTAINLKESLFSVSLWEDFVGGQLLIIKVHHIIADGWSFHILFRDFLHMLRDTTHSFDENKENNPVLYKSFCEHNNAYPKTEEGSADRDYWKTELASLSPLWNIPCSKPVPKILSGKGLFHSFPLPLPEELPLKSTVFEYSLTVFALLLNRYTNQNDISLVIPLLGRASPIDRRTVGHFVNLAVIRLPMNHAHSFSDLLEISKTKIAKAQKHQMYPFSLLIEEAALPRTTGHGLATDAYFGMIKIPNLPENDFSMEYFEQQGAPWHLSFEIFQEGNDAQAIIRYPVELWDTKDVESLAGHFSNIFSMGLSSPEKPLSEYLKFTPAETEDFRRRQDLSLRSDDKKIRKEPENDTQRRLWDIWAEVLNRKDFGIEDDFFSIGGHSLSAAQVMARIRGVMRKQIPLGILFRLQTISALAEYLDALPEDEDQDTPVQSHRLSNEDSNRAPLSFSQSRLWFLNRLEPESQAYNMHVSITIQGKLDYQTMNLAFRDLQIRHESLRTTFHEHEGEPVQVIHPDPLVELEYIDFSGFGAESTADRTQRKIEEHSSEPYNLSVAALRIALIVLGVDDYVLSLSMHHVIGDQWSWGVISRDLTEFYMARLTGREPGLPPLRIQYQDYSAWQVKTLMSRQMLQAGKYWKETLAGLPILELPLDRKRPTVNSNHGGVVRYPFSGDEKAQINALAESSQSTPYIVLLTSFAILLYRYTGLKDLPIGTPTANRDRKEFEDLIGTFVNTLVLRIPLKGEETFLSLLGRIKEIFLDAYEFRMYPFEKLVSDLNPTRDSSHLPLAQVLFNLVNAPLQMPFEKTNPVESFPVEPQGSQFDLSLSIDLNISGQAEFFFNQDILDKASVQAMCDAYFLILREALSNPDMSVDELPLMTSRRRTMILNEWNMTDRPYPGGKNVAEMLWDSAARHGDNIAAVFEEGSYTYSRLFSMASTVARNLTERGVREGDIVGIHLHRGPKLIVSLLATLAAGAAYVPIDPSYPEARKMYMLDHSRASVLITEPSLENTFSRENKTPRIILEHLNESTEQVTPVHAAPDSPAYILYTSGSTGKPKGVVIPQRALANFLFSMRETPGIAESDRLLSVTPVSFDISGLEIYLPLTCGATLIMPSRDKVIDPMELIRIIENMSVTFLQATPATWRMLLESGWNGSLKTILCGGEAFPTELIDPLLERCENLWNMYGPTETTIWSTAYRLTKREFPIPLGKPIANTKIYILDGKKEPLPPGIYGDIYIAGTGLALGYRDAPELTKAAFLPHLWIPGQLMYLTGDKGRYRQDGNIEYAGRGDNQIKLNGHRIELGEIEAALSDMEDIKQAVCMLNTSAQGVTRLVAYLVPGNKAENPTQKEIEAFLLTRLPVYMLPQAYAFLDKIPLTPSGKVDRKALPEIRYTGDKEKIPPADEMERIIHKIWTETMTNGEIGVEDDFFSLGGHSLLAVRLTAGIVREFGIEITLRSFFSEPTVRGCARLIRAHLGKKVPAKNESAFESDIIFPMRVNGLAQPVFLIAGIYAEENGLYRYLSSLVHFLGESHPVYGLRPRGLIRPAEFYESVPEIADEYIQNIRKVNPDGPYNLIGECVGGIIAYEIARQLVASGAIVNSLILLDTEFPRSKTRKFRIFFSRRLYKLERMSLLLLGMALQPRKTSKIIKGVLQGKRASISPRTEAEIEHLRFKQVEKRYAELARQYKLLPYTGDVHILINEEDHKYYSYLGWRGIKSEQKESDHILIQIVKGNHVTRLTTYGKETSEAINRLL